MAKTETRKKYVVTIGEAEGTCNSSVFQKMASKGDITSVGIKEHVDEVIKVKGYASAKVETDEKEFEVTYIDTDKGYLSTGSRVFIDGLTDYYADGIRAFRIVKVKCSKGATFKAVPVMEETDTDTEVDELPFN